MRDSVSNVGTLISIHLGLWERAKELYPAMGPPSPKRAGRQQAMLN